MSIPTKIHIGVSDGGILTGRCSESRFHASDEPYVHQPLADELLKAAKNLPETFKTLNLRKAIAAYEEGKR